MYAVETTKLTKKFATRLGGKEILAVDELDLTVEKGEIFGFLGPNGAGKTTTIKMLLGIVFPSYGRANILGADIGDVKAREKVGYLPEGHHYPGWLTGERTLDFLGKLSGVEDERRRRRIDETLELVGMEKWRKVKIKKYSRGMTQRLGLAQAILSDPELVFLDEPTEGIDPIGRKAIRDLLLHLKEQGKTIFLNSHILSEVELVCDRVGILDKGRLIKIGSVKELTHKGEDYVIEVESCSPEMEQEVRNLVLSCERKEDQLRVSVKDPKEINGVIDALRARGADIRAVVPQKTSLEDLFVTLISRWTKLNS